MVASRLKTCRLTGFHSYCFWIGKKKIKRRKIPFRCLSHNSTQSRALFFYVIIWCWIFYESFQRASVSDILLPNRISTCIEAGPSSGVGKDRAQALPIQINTFLSRYYITLKSLHRFTYKFVRYYSESVSTHGKL